MVFFMLCCYYSFFWYSRGFLGIVIGRDFFVFYVWYRVSI